jgi:hypothetical protein
MMSKKQFQVVAKNCAVGVGVSSPLSESIEADSVRIDESGCLLFEVTSSEGGKQLVQAFSSGHWCKVTQRQKE